jgi:hypothetical protein
MQAFAMEEAKKWNIVGPYISYGLFQTTGEMCSKFGPIGAEMWICIRYKHTYIQTFIFIYKIILYYVHHTSFLSTSLPPLTTHSKVERG